MTTRMTDAGPHFPTMGLSRISLAVIVIIGISSLLFLWFGFQAYGNKNPDEANLLIGMGAVGLAAIGYLFFRTKAVSSQKLLDEKAEVVTILNCPSCALKRVRDFKRGDYVYKIDETCTRCEGTMTITGIHRKAEPKKKKR